MGRLISIKGRIFWSFGNPNPFGLNLPGFFFSWKQTEGWINSNPDFNALGFACFVWYWYIEAYSNEYRPAGVKVPSCILEKNGGKSLTNKSACSN